jgi:GTPase SAR1 family protein
MFVEAINTIGTLANAYEIGKKSQPLLGKLIRRIRDRKLNIVICGAAGTGKSTLGKLLSGEFDREDILQSYQISLRTEELELDSKTPSSILVLPGQSTFWNEALRKIANNQVNLIINIVAYGYQSGLTDYQNLPSYQQGATPEEFLEAYTKDKRRLEIDLLDQLIPHLKVASNSKIVMMTLVTKQDLWWQNRHLVRDYYQLGIYSESIQQIQNTLGQANFIHDYISASLLTENFALGNGGILAPVAEGYDQKIQLVNFDRVLQFIENNLEIELGR